MSVNFAGSPPVVRVWGNQLLTHDDIRRTIIASLPGVFAAIVIVVVSIVHLMAVYHDEAAAAENLAAARSHAVYPLDAQTLSRDRAAHAELVANELQSLHGQPLAALAPTVAVANVLPADVRVKSLSASGTIISIAQAEALSYNAVIDARRILMRRFDTTITTLNIPSQTQDPTADQSIAQGQLPDSFWKWTATVAPLPHENNNATTRADPPFPGPARTNTRTRASEAP
jgi:hypothetical protein